MPPKLKSRTSATSGPPPPAKIGKRGTNSRSEPAPKASRKSKESRINKHPIIRRGTTQLSKASSDYSHSNSRTALKARNRTTNPAYVIDDGTTIAIPDPPRQSKIDALLEAEMEDAIFCDPNFVENYLTIDEARITAALGKCNAKLDDFHYPKITEESQLYKPITSVLNIIKQAVNNVAEKTLSDFEDVHKKPILSHGEDTIGLMPDLALFNDATQHWETVRMPIEVKVKATYLKVGMKQLSRYARAVFANQLHRRHVYGMVFCKWAATFVRFDRSGILYSKPIDIREEEFRKAFAGLMLLDEETFGYDTAFTTRPKSDGKLEYYIDLPATAFPSEATPDATGEPSTTTPGPSSGTDTPSKSPTKRLKVMRTLCHRKSIRARATIVLRVREVVRSGVSEKLEEPQGGMKTRAQTKKENQLTEEPVEELGTRDYVLKLMWRDPNKKMEGEVLERLVGIYGVGQYMWHSDVFKKCSTPDCGMSTENSCGKCLDKTPDRRELLVAENMGNLDITVPEQVENDKEPQYEEVDTDKLSPVHVEETSRIYCRLLMSTVGSLLCTAESPRELLEAVLDAILGYWRLVNMGLLHRDISDGNVLMLREGGYDTKEWESLRVVTDEKDPMLANSEKLLQEILDELKRDPTGMLNDFDLSKTHNMMGVSFFDDMSSENEESDLDEPGSKRRKLDLGANADAPSSSFNKEKGRETTIRGGSSFSRATNADKGAHRIDFRTGTPTYMSVRILGMSIGQQYEHHFMDDLESFFWLILWCVAEHIDVRGEDATDEAYDLLNKLSQHDLSSIADKKARLLMDCHFNDGEDMQEKLEALDNAWATNPAIVSVILKLGCYFFGAFTSKKSLSKYQPDTAFPAVVKVIMDALEQLESSPPDSESE
ncbi:hypothetical protein FRC07_011541 [Ceratobasidium sp. 392]|nr:hypothetical protein FRC07_011541 [Ceratobasidium sp. 392]